MRLSVGIPVHNEEEVLPALLARLLAVLDSAGRTKSSSSTTEARIDHDGC